MAKKQLNKWKSHMRRIVALDPKSKDALFIYDCKKAVDLEGIFTGARVHTAIKKGTTLNNVNFMWADEYENKYKILLPGHLAELPI